MNYQGCVVLDPDKTYILFSKNPLKAHISQIVEICRSYFSGGKGGLLCLTANEAAVKSFSLGDLRIFRDNLNVLIDLVERKQNSRKINRYNSLGGAYA